MNVLVSCSWSRLTSLSPSAVTFLSRITLLPLPSELLLASAAAASHALKEARSTTLNAAAAVAAGFSCVACVSVDVSVIFRRLLVSFAAAVCRCSQPLT